MEDFSIELAGVPVRIRCRFAENRRFFRDYLTDKAALFAVDPSPDDLKQMQAEFDRMDESDGLIPHRRTAISFSSEQIHCFIWCRRGEGAPIGENPLRIRLSDRFAPP